MSGGRSSPEAEAFSLIYVVILDVLTMICHKFEVVRIIYSEQRLGKVTHVGAVRPMARRGRVVVRPFTLQPGSQFLKSSPRI